MELDDLTKDPEDFITDLVEHCTRMIDDPLNKVIADKRFMLHILNSLPIEYKSIVEKGTRSKNDKLALTTTNGNTFREKQGFKGNWNTCVRYNHKTTYCWENQNKKNKKNNF